MDTPEGRTRSDTRRAFLGAVGATAAVGLAGCITTDENDVDANSEGATRILRGFEAAGVEPPVETTIYANAENDERIRWSQLVQYELNETGLFDVEFESLEWGQYEQLCFNMADNEENAIVSLDVSGGWDPHTYVEPLFHSNNHAPAGLNFNHFAEETVDELIDAGLAEDDPKRRREIYAELQHELVDHTPVSPVRFGESVTVYRRDALEEWRQYPLPGSEYESVYAPYAGTCTDLAEGSELVGDAVATISNPDPVRMRDTTSNMATSLLYEGLLAVDFDGTPRPQLATDWTRLDETSYRFELREGVTFHNGETLTADHVRFSLDRYEGTPREHDVFEWYDGTDIVDDTTLEIHLTEPYGPFETTVGLPIVPLAAGEGDVDLSAEPVGTGPYAFDERSAADYWQLERFDDHWFDGDEDVPAQPPIETIRLRIITETASRQAALETGEIDLATGVPTESVDGFVDDDAFGVERNVAGQYDFLVYPAYLEPFDRVDVRRGIDRLLPRDRILDDVYAGYGSVAYTAVPPLLEEFAGPELEADIVAEYFE